METGETNLTRDLAAMLFHFLCLSDRKGLWILISFPGLSNRNWNAS